MRVPPQGWLAGLIEAAHRAGAVVIFDEVYTGFGRTGEWFRYQTEGVRPDLLCLGKGMAGGFPISACIGSAEVMDAWGASRGPALHTQTFLGNPVGCAMALACMGVLEAVIPTVTAKGDWLRAELERRGLGVRGVGLMLGVLHDRAFLLSRALLQRGYLLLPAGEPSTGEVLAIVPPLVVTKRQLQGFLTALDECLAEQT